MRIVLIGNYIPDKQESMKRFANMLDSGFRAVGINTEVWHPSMVCGTRNMNTNAGVGKWLGYLDKWVFFPFLLRWRIFSRKIYQVETFFHICDHSNSPYISYLPLSKTSITCHDVLAIRGGLGYADAHVSASSLGKILQTWILSNLSRFEKIAAVSHHTLNQLQDLVSPANVRQKQWKVIHNAFNSDFYPMQADQAHERLADIGFDVTTPFLLHVGSRLARKNRSLLLDLVAQLGERWQGNICFAGEAVDSSLLQHAHSLGLQARIKSIIKPDHLTLVALYSTCTAFVFPSYSEGFGWPVIEAQACGAPVIASDVAPMSEVSGGAALHANPNEVRDFTDAFLSLQDTSVRSRLIQQGFVNCQRFESSTMINAYLTLIGI